jgi:formiminoglutamate deiminase
VLVEVEGERITAVTAGTEAPASAERLAGLTLPGLANAHSHAFHRALRGRTQAGAGTFWTWREEMYSVAERLDPDSYLGLARATFAEMALAGITAVGEFHYLHHDRNGSPYDEPNAMGMALIQAAAEAGIRITLLETCYLHGGIGEEPRGVQRRFADAGAGEWAARFEELSPGPGARIGAAIHSVRAVDPASAQSVARWASERGVPLHAHVSEQPAENEACQAAYGKTPAMVLGEAGALTPWFTAVHATHLTDADIRLLGGSGATCCLCPTTERDLADGIGPGRRLAEGGADLALGSDSHAVIDLFEEARAVELDERLETGERGRHATSSLLRAATEGGHAAIGWPEAGRIEPGALADLMTLGLDSVRLAGTEADSALDAVLFAATPADVANVIAGGEVVVSDGVHNRLDVSAELAGSISALYA